VCERARRELGSWPTADTIVEQIVRARAQAAEDESDPEEKSRFRTLAEGVGGMARDIVVGATAAQLGQL
jgi:hypothetical protein